MRWTKVGIGKKAVYHRFMEHAPGEWHWNGSTAGTTIKGKANLIRISDVPIAIKRM